MSQWINIDRLGTKGIEPDLLPVHRDPQSLDLAMNVRAVGPNLANAGGYQAVVGGDFPQETPTFACANPVESIGSRTHPGTSLQDGYLSAWAQGTALAGQIVYGRNLALSSNGVNIFLNGDYIVADYDGNQIDAQSFSINTGMNGADPWSFNDASEGVAGRTEVVIACADPQGAALVDWYTGTVTPWTYSLELLQQLGDEFLPGKLKHLDQHIYAARGGNARKINRQTGVVEATLATTGNFMIDETALRVFIVNLNAGVELVIQEVNPASLTFTGTQWDTDQAYSSGDDWVYGIVANKHYCFPTVAPPTVIRTVPLPDGGGTDIAQLVQLGAGNNDRIVMRTGFNTAISAGQLACVAPGT